MVLKQQRFKQENSRLRKFQDVTNNYQKYETTDPMVNKGLKKKLK